MYRAPRTKSQAGFTLIELMATTAMAMVVFSSLFGAMIAQQKSYGAQMAASEASQNARAALGILKNELRMAGWGINGHPDANFPPVGTCNNATDPQDCNNLPTVGDTTRNADRLRLVTMSPSRFDSLTNWQSGPSTLRTHRKSVYAEEDAPGIPEGALALIDGECDDGTPFTGVVTVRASVEDSEYWHTYQFDPPPTGLPAPPCTNLADGFRISSADVVDYYIDRSEETPRLMRHWNPGGEDGFGNATVARVVAYGIDSLQVQYGIDLGLNFLEARPDQQIDLWCDDLTNCDTSAESSTAFTPQQLAARVQAVRIAVVAAAPTTAVANASDFSVFDETIPADDQRRWVFRGTVRLRNNELE